MQAINKWVLSMTKTQPEGPESSPEKHQQVQVVTLVSLDKN